MVYKELEQIQEKIDFIDNKLMFIYDAKTAMFNEEIINLLKGKEYLQHRKFAFVNKFCKRNENN